MPDAATKARKRLQGRFAGKVLHITRDFPPRSTGGISTAVEGMARASVRAGLECNVISFDGWRPKAGNSQSRNSLTDSFVNQTDDGISVLRLSTPTELPGAREFAAELHPDVLHVHHSMLWPFAAELRARLGIPALLTVHVHQGEQNRLRQISGATMSSKAQAAALAEADLVIAPSRAVADLLHRDRICRQSSIRIIGLGLEDTDFARQSYSAREARRSGHCRNSVLYVGRFSDINGTDELFTAIPKILDRVEFARFVVVGGIPENHKAEARWLRRWERSASDRARSRVQFTGWLPRDELAHHYRDAGLLISPSWFETFGMVVLEAMLHGVPISATSAGGVSELITHEHTGLLARPRDVEELVANTVALLEDSERAFELGAAAAAAARARHLWSQVIPKLLLAYRESH